MSAVLAGPAFSRSTIPINVLGSFVIGFFGTLTAADGRFALPFGARAFSDQLLHLPRHRREHVGRVTGPGA